MKLHIIFSKNNKIGSRFISWSTQYLGNFQATPSHVAILVNERWVLESTLEAGVRILPYNTWNKLNHEVAKIQITNNILFKRIKFLFKKIGVKKYDWPGVIYLGWRIFLNKYFKKPIPTINKWERPNKYFCTEVIGYILDMDLDMVTPIQLLNKLILQADQPNKQTKR